MNVVPVLALMLSLGCASTAEKKIESDIVKQPESNAAQASASGRLAIEQSTQLTPEQKQKMLALMEQARNEMSSIRKSEAQSKASLFKYLADGQYEEKEIAVYRSNLEKLEKKKMDLMFSNLKEARKILGKEVKYDPELMDFNRYSVERF